MAIILFPTELEAQQFRRQEPNAEIVISGVGMAATAATIARLYAEGRTCEGVILAGIAGVYGNEVAIGEVVEIIEECCHDLPERFRHSYKTTPRTPLRAVRGTTQHQSKATTLAEIENMEGAVLFAMAESLGFEAIEIRAISNRVGEPFERWEVERACEALTQTLKDIFF